MSWSVINVAEMRSAIAEARNRFEDGFNQGDVAGAVRACYLAEACLLPLGGDIIRGREGIARFWASAAREQKLEDLHMTPLDLQPCGDSAAYEVGRCSFRRAGGAPEEVKYVVVWQREEGEWRLAVDAWN